MSDSNDQRRARTTNVAPAWQGPPPRYIHLVKVGDAEFFFWELKRAMAKAAVEPEAMLERVAVH